MFKERLAIALEANTGLDVIHALQNAGDFGQSDIVDVIRRQAGRGVAADQIPIKRRTTGHRAKTDTVAGDRQIFGGEEIAQADQRRIDPLTDHFAIGGLQTDLIGGCDAGRESLHRFHHDRCIKAASSQAVQLIDHVVYHQLGLHHAGLHALAESQDGQIQQQRKLIASLQRILVIFQCLERCSAFPGLEFGEEIVEAEEMIDRPRRGGCEQRWRQTGEIGFALPFERVVTHLFIGGQRVPVDGGQRCQLVFGGALFGGEGSVRDQFAQLVGAARVTTEQSIERIALQIVGIAGGKQRHQARRWRFAGGGDRRLDR